jgi:hypothetical protein
MNRSQKLISLCESIKQKKISEEEAKSKGWYLLPEHKKWLADNLSTLVEVNVDDCYQWEYNPPLDENNKTVISIVDDMKQGYRLPIIEIRYDSSRRKYKISDGQHRWVAWGSLGNKTIPALLTKE